MTLTHAPGLIEITREKLAYWNGKCALVPGHFVVRERPTGFAVPMDNPNEVHGWVCATCTRRLRIRPRPQAELIRRPWLPGDHFVRFVTQSKMPSRCALDPDHRRYTGAVSGLVYRLGDGDLSNLDTAPQQEVGWACAECTIGLISR